MSTGERLLSSWFPPFGASVPPVRSCAALCRVLLQDLVRVSKTYFTTYSTFEPRCRAGFIQSGLVWLVEKPGTPTLFSNEAWPSCFADVANSPLLPLSSIAGFLYGDSLVAAFRENTNVQPEVVCRVLPNALAATKEQLRCLSAMKYYFENEKLVFSGIDRIIRVTQHLADQNTSLLQFGKNGAKPGGEKRVTPQLVDGMKRDLGAADKFFKSTRNCEHALAIARKVYSTNLYPNLKRWRNEMKQKNVDTSRVTFHMIDAPTLWELPWDPHILNYLRHKFSPSKMADFSHARSVLADKNVSRSQSDAILASIKNRIGREKEMRTAIATRPWTQGTQKTRADALLRVTSAGGLDRDVPLLGLNASSFGVGVVGHALLDGLITDSSLVPGILEQITAAHDHGTYNRVLFGNRYAECEALFRGLANTMVLPNASSAFDSMSGADAFPDVIVLHPKLLLSVDFGRVLSDLRKRCSDENTVIMVPARPDVLSVVQKNLSEYFVLAPLSILLITKDPSEPVFDYIPQCMSWGFEYCNVVIAGTAACPPWRLPGSTMHFEPDRAPITRCTESEHAPHLGWKAWEEILNAWLGSKREPSVVFDVGFVGGSSLARAAVETDRLLLTWDCDDPASVVSRLQIDFLEHVSYKKAVQYLSTWKSVLSGLKHEAAVEALASLPDGLMKDVVLSLSDDPTKAAAPPPRKKSRTGTEATRDSGAR